MSQEQFNKHIHNLELFEANLNQLGDKELIEQLKQLFAPEKKLGDAILLNLQEINARRRYLTEKERPKPTSVKKRSRESTHGMAPRS